MDALAAATIVLGGVVLALRLPLLVAPEATLAVYRAMIATNGRARCLAAVFGPLGAWLAFAAWGSALGASQALGALGLLIAGGAVAIGLAPGAYRRMAGAMLEALEEPAALRILGLLGSLVGAALVWLGATMGADPAP